MGGSGRRVWHGSDARWEEAPRNVEPTLSVEVGSDGIRMAAASARAG